MSTFKRAFMIAYLICSLVVLVLFALALLLPGGAAMMAFLHGCIPLAVLLVLVMIVALVGLIAYTGLAVLVTITRASARLRATESGEISIEKSALVSTASRALAQVEDMTLQGLTVDVLQRGDTAVIDAKVTATPLGTDSLMTLASRIQGTTKRALEAFTEHEVRYVAVNFVEPRRRGEQMGAGPDPDAYESPFEEMRARAEAQAKQDEACRAAEARERAAAQATAAAAPAAQPVTEADVATDGAEAGTPVSEKKPSLWERAKAKAAGLRSRLDAEDVVETQAEVVTDVLRADGPTTQVKPSSETATPVPNDALDSAEAASKEISEEAAPKAQDADEPAYETDESSTCEGSPTGRRGTL